jgi:uncharacterized protein (DUF885 family)
LSTAIQDRVPLTISNLDNTLFITYRYRELCATIQKKLPKYFPKFPRAQLEIVAKNSPTAPAAYYMVPNRVPTSALVRVFLDIG